MSLFDFLWLIGSGVSLCVLIFEYLNENEKNKMNDFPVIGAVVFCFLTSWSIAICLYYLKNKSKKKKNCK